MGRNNKEKRKAKKKKKTLRSKNFAKNTPSSKNIGPVFAEFKNPLAGIGDNERKKLIDGMGSESKKDFGVSLDKLKKLLRKYDPILIISIISGYTLTIAVSDKGVKNNEKQDGTHQFHVEILQALILQISEDDLGKEFATRHVIQDILDELKILSRSFSFSRMSSDLAKLNEEDKAIQLIQESFRSYTQVVRNWGYFSQVTKISKELYRHFDKELLDKAGVSATNIIDTFEFMVLSTEKSMTEWMQALQLIKREKYTKNQFYMYADLLGQDRKGIDELLNEFSFGKLANQKTFSFIMMHYDLRLVDCYTFSVKDISNGVGISEKQALAVIDSFSYLIGGLNSHKTEYIFLDNPIWEKPVIKLSDSECFCSIPQAFFSFILIALNGFIENVNGKALKDRRAKYLEEKIEEIVKKRFPSAQTVSGVKWKYNDTLYETDIISFIDSHAIIIEAKSHKVTKPALRGAPDRIKRHIKEIIIDPSIQSRRLEQHLKKLCSNDDYSDDLLQQQIPVNLKDIKKIIRVSVSLENLTVIQADVRSLSKTGWIPEELELCPSMNIADFETLFDLLEHPLQIIHYLSQRSSLQRKVNFLGDELDFMALYLTTLLNIEHLKDRGAEQVIISGMSTPIDYYYDSLSQGITVPKPQPKISNLFQKILNGLEKRNTPRWTEMGVLLNMLTPDDQVKIESSIKANKKIVNRTWEKEGHRNTIIYVPPTCTDMSFVYLLFKNGNSERRDEFIQNAISLGLEEDHVERCLIIAKNIDDDNVPYHFIALAGADV